MRHDTDTHDQHARSRSAGWTSPTPTATRSPSSPSSTRATALDGPGARARGRGPLLAAISLASGEVIADPFSRTAELRALLELRAGQLRQRVEAAGCERGAARPAVGGSPAGSISALPRWG